MSELTREAASLEAQLAVYNGHPRTAAIVAAADRLKTLNKEELATVEERAVAEVDCPMCPATKHRGCNVVINGRVGSRLPGYAHIARQMALVERDMKDEDIMGPVSYAKKSNTDVDDLLG